MKMKRIITSFLLVNMIIVFSCNKRESNSDRTHDSYLKNLWNNKVEYIGDNSKVISLVNMVFGDTYGTHEKELMTKNEPYGLVITFTEMKQDIKNIDLEKHSILLLSLIKNVGYIRIEYNGYQYNLSVEEANKKTGFNIKDLYMSEEKYFEFMKENH